MKGLFGVGSNTPAVVAVWFRGIRASSAADRPSQTLTVPSYLQLYYYCTITVLRMYYYDCTTTVMLLCYCSTAGLYAVRPQTPDAPPPRPSRESISPYQDAPPPAL